MSLVRAGVPSGFSSCDPASPAASPGQAQMRSPVTPGHLPVSAVCIVFTQDSVHLERMGRPRPPAPKVLGMPRLPSVQGAAVAGLCPGRAVASLPSFLGPWLVCGRDPLQEMPALGLTLAPRAGGPAGGNSSLSCFSEPRLAPASRSSLPSGVPGCGPPSGSGPIPSPRP